MLVLFLALLQIEANPAITSVGLWTGCKFPQCVNLGAGLWREPHLACSPTLGGATAEEAQARIPVVAPGVGSTGDNGELALSV